MTDLEIAIARVEAASVEMERAIANLRDVDAHALTIEEHRQVAAVHNRARRSVA